MTGGTTPESGDALRGHPDITDVVVGYRDNTVRGGVLIEVGAVMPYRPPGRRTDHPKMRRIVVGVDGSSASRTALGWAAEVATSVGAIVEVIRAWRYPPPYDEWGTRPTNYGFLPVFPEPGQMERVAEAELGEATRELSGHDPAVPMEQRVVRGHPSAVLIEASERADLLVVGRRGHSGFAGLILGSVARACTEHAHCPVVVVPDA